MPTISGAIGKAAGFQATASGYTSTVTAGGANAINDQLVLAHTGASGNFRLASIRASGTDDVDGVAFKIGATEYGRMRLGILAWGTTVVTGAATGDAVLANTKILRGVTAAGTGTVPLVRLDANGYVQLGDAMGAGNMTSIGHKAAVNLPAGGANENGVIGIDSTNNRLIYYSGGNRYYIAGTSF